MNRAFLAYEGRPPVVPVGGIRFAAPESESDQGHQEADSQQCMRACGAVSSAKGDQEEHRR